MTDHGFITLLWTGNSAIGRLILLLLLALGGAAASAALRHRARYAREQRTLDEVRARLQRLRDAEQPEGDRSPVPAPVDLAELRDKVDTQTLIGDRLATLARMKQARVKVNVDALQQMTVLRESASFGLAFPGYAVDVAMMLGMLGTFVGLCLMLLQMQGVLPTASGVPAAGGFAEAAASLGGIIASKKTAFVTTLVGLACAIVLSALNFLLARAQSAFYDALERFTTAELLPATMPAVEDETAMEKLSLQLSDTFASLGNLAEHHRENLERLQEMETSFGAIVASIRAITQHSARGPAEEAAGALTTLVRQLGDANDALVKVAESVALSAARERQQAVHARHRDETVGAWLDDGLSIVRRNPLPALLGAGAVVSLLAVLF
jgi:biopolymer transport protein ExbB/TolQ